VGTIDNIKDDKMKLTRKPRSVAIHNPLLPEYKNASWLDDLVVGCVRSMRAADVSYKNKTEVVSIDKVKRLFDDMVAFTTALIQAEIHVSERQARVYLQIIRLCIPQIIQYQEQGLNKYYREKFLKVNSSREQFNDLKANFYVGLNKHETKFGLEAHKSDCIPLEE
jgi:hypothetical protein